VLSLSHTMLSSPLISLVLFGSSSSAILIMCHGLGTLGQYQSVWNAYHSAAGFGLFPGTSMETFGFIFRGNFQQTPQWSALRGRLQTRHLCHVSAVVFALSIQPAGWGTPQDISRRWLSSHILLFLSNQVPKYKTWPHARLLWKLESTLLWKLRRRVFVRRDHVGL